MPVKRGIVTQSATDAFTQKAIETNLTAEGKTGWQIVGFRMYWSTGDTVAANDVDTNGILSTVTSITTFDDLDEIGRLNWAVANTGGIAVAYPMELIKEMIIPDGGRITVQPTIYVGLASVGAGSAQTAYFEVIYNIVKLSDLEVLRLLQGGV